MAGGKLSPRQKMINMMYLVLTALLALNVTKEVINAFVTINESVVLSKNNLDKKNQTTYAAFSQAVQTDPGKYGKANTSAQAVKKAAEDLNTYIESLKIRLVRESDQIDPKDPTPSLPDMERKDDYDTPTHIMIGADDHTGKGASADTLRKKLDAYKKIIIANAPDASRGSYQKTLDNLLNTEDPKKPEDGKRTWELMSFYHNPVVATVALLSKFQSDVRTAESQVVEDLFNSVGKYDFRPDHLEARVIPNSTVVTNGSNYEAQVFLAATSSTLAPEVFINASYDNTSKTCNGCDGTALPIDAGGYAKYVTASSGEGERKWGGVIRVKKSDGSTDYYPFNSSYVAQKPNSVVSADKMNVLYIGVDNPMSISVPGISNDKVKVSIEGAGGTMRPNATLGGGHFTATVTTTGQAKVKVSADIGGRVLPMGEFVYRVKRVPNPVATIAGSQGGTINKNTLKAGALVPVLENFDFELFFKVTGFKTTIIRKRQDPLEFDVQGNQLSADMRAAIEKCSAGDRVIFEFIKAKMDKNPNDPTRNLTGITFTIQ